MNILHKLTWKSMWKNKTRTAVTVVGILLSAARFMAVTTLGYSLWNFLVRGEIYTYGDWFVRFDYVTEEEMPALRAEKDITDLADYQVLGILKTQEDSNGPMSTVLLAAGDRALFDTMPIRLTEGRLPQNSREVVLPEDVLKVLAYYGMSTAIGSTIDLSLITQYNGYPSGVTPETDKEPFRASYTVTGYVSTDVVQLCDMGLLSMLTYNDGDQGQALWHRVFAHCAPSRAQKLASAGYGFHSTQNSALLSLYGITRYSNYNLLIAALAAVLCLIILVGSVSLIYNAFSISVSERTKQLGLLCSVGATKKQLRASVLWEALSLSAIGIPAGLLSGYVGIAITIRLLSQRIDAVITLAEGTVKLRTEFSGWALLAAAVIALLTVLLSAAIPARRATRITPLEAIRQNTDYFSPKTAVKLSKLSSKLFGLPGLLAKKYYKVSRKKYRATVISLAVSIVLLISAACFSNSLRTHIRNNTNTESYDIDCYAGLETSLLLKEQPFVARSALVASDNFKIYATDEQLSREFLELWPQMEEFYHGSRNFEDLSIIYLEDAVLREYLVSKGIDPAPYFNPEDPMALVCSKDFKTYYVQDEEGKWVSYFFSYAPYAEDTKRLPLFTGQPPKELMPPSDGEGPNFASFEHLTDEKGQVYLSFYRLIHNDGDKLGKDENNAYRYLMRFAQDESGNWQIRYYLCDPETGLPAEEAAASQYADGPKLRLGATIEELPFGISTNARRVVSQQTVILPMSLASEEVRSGASLCFTVLDYPAAINWLRNHLKDRRYVDHRADEELNRALLLMINVFSAGFVVLISLISIANVFNTISTNIGLRRRDFGMLRSAGMQERDLLRMMSFECLSYGFSALAWGLPISLGMSLLIHRIDNSVTYATYAPPWTAIAVAAVSVFAVVFITMFYAVSKLRTDNPMDAIRMENI